MGKRKRATKPPPKKKMSKLDKTFDCPFCGHEQTVECCIQRDIKFGRVECRVCGVKYNTVITHLDEEIDLYHKWLDACEEASANKEKENAAPAPTSVAEVDVADDDDDVDADAEE